MMAQRELTYNYTVDRKSDGIRINNCYIEMVDAGVWIYQKEDSNRLFLPYSNIDMIIEYNDSTSDEIMDFKGQEMNNTLNHPHHKIKNKDGEFFVYRKEDIEALQQRSCKGCKAFNGVEDGIILCLKFHYVKTGYNFNYAHFCCNRYEAKEQQ